MCFLKTISGSKLPIIAKVIIPCSHENRKISLQFFVTKYNLPYCVIGRQGLSQLYAGWRRRLMIVNHVRGNLTNKEDINLLEVISGYFISRIKLFEIGVK